MFKMTIGVTVSMILLTSPALAQDRGFYVGGDVGGVISSKTDQTYTPAAVAGSTGDISTDHELGLNGSAFAGYDFGPLRIEADMGYMSAGFDKAKTSFPVGSLAAGSHGAEGKIKARTAMVNLLWDVGSFEDFELFAGAGTGRAQVEVSEMSVSSGPTLLDDKDREWRSAWQGIVGVRTPLTGKIDAHVRYIYLNVDDAEMTGFGGRAVTTRFKSHSVVGGVSYRF